jgi:hypothetical protein
MRSVVQLYPGPPLYRGAVAQLGERLVCNQEATGSIPVSSTRNQSSVAGHWGTRLSDYLEHGRRSANWISLRCNRPCRWSDHRLGCCRSGLSVAIYYWASRASDSAQLDWCWECCCQAGRCIISCILVANGHSLTRPVGFVGSLLYGCAAGRD